MAPLVFRELEITSRCFLLVLLVLGGFVLAGIYAFLHIEDHGHVATGMNNQVVWGLPHVVAIFLIISAVGVVHIASLGAVFNRPFYQPFGRLALLLGMCLLLGGLLLILLDLGQPDRLSIALTHFNFDSSFAWNILRYSVFFVIMSTYLWSMMSRTVLAKRCYKPVAYLGFIWPNFLMIGIASTFGALTVRDGFDTGTLAVQFIIFSYLLGLSCFSLAFIMINWLEGITVVGFIQSCLSNHLKLFKFVPFFILALLAVMAGVFYQLYQIIIGGQLKPLVLFPNALLETRAEVSYTPSMYEILLSLGCVSCSLLMFIVCAKVLRVIKSDSP